MDKLRAVLRRPDRDFLEALSPRITVFRPRSARAPVVPLTANTHQVLLTSIAQQQVVQLDYRAGYDGASTQRDVEPIGVYYGQHWHVVAFCRLRQEFRDFRLDRIAGLHLRDEHFAPQVLAHVEESKHNFGWTHEQQLPTGGREMTFLVGYLEHMARWLLMYTNCVTVVSPPELRQRMRELADEAHQHFCE
jgi:predicted DNA-binding transcriptional regulator YafY